VGTSGISRLAVIGALAAALALGACGRKGPLEAPPSSNALAAAPQQPGPAAPQTGPAPFESPTDNDMPVPQASKKTFILDPLLGSDPPRRQAPPSR
jgi:predicted small lipoprotein YifL